MPKKLASIIEALRQTAGALNITHGNISGEEARKLSADLSEQIEKLEALGQPPGSATAEEDPPNQPPPSGP